MADISHEWGSDLTIGSNGDLSLATGPTLARQRVLRRLLTNPGDYIWHPDYGAGFPAYVGLPEDAVRVDAVARQQLALEAGVAQSPPPTVAVSAGADGVLVLAISYTDADSGEPQVLGLSVSATGVSVI